MMKVKTNPETRLGDIDVPQHTFPDGIDENLSRRQKRAIKRALNPKKNRKW